VKSKAKDWLDAAHSHRAQVALIKLSSKASHVISVVNPLKPWTKLEFLG
jgi:hypothetical protein